MPLSGGLMSFILECGGRMANFCCLLSCAFEKTNRASSSEETVKEENSIHEKSKFGLEKGNGFSAATVFCKCPSILDNSN
ncbi:hypothetical protein STEG23_027855 [Scotinomys teguina]